MHPLGDLAQQLGREILGDRRGQCAALFDLEPGQPFGAKILDHHFGQLVDIFARIIGGGPLGVDAAHAAPFVGRCPEHAKFAGRGQIGEIDQLHVETQIGRVVAIVLHRLVVGHSGQRQLKFQPQQLPGQPGHQTVDHADDVLGVDEAHLHVELRELGLAIGPQVLVAETAGDLHVAIVAGDHQNLLVKLRRLRQGVKRAVMNAAGHQVIAGPFGRAAAEHGRFDVDEAVLVEISAHAANDLVPQQQRVLHLGAAQIEIAILEPQVLVRQILAAGLQWRGEALVENLGICPAALRWPRSAAWD